MNRIQEYIKKHPNNGKQIIYTEAYLEMRRVLMERIWAIENATKGTLLSNEADIHERLLPSLKRSLNSLRERFEAGGMTIDVKCCAQYILDMEREQITDPLKCCRYYNGQDFSDNEDAIFANYEKRWMEWRVSSQDQDYEYLVENISEYMSYGLLRFDEYGLTPISLKALLYNRYCHWGGWDSNTDSFKRWYYNSYCKEQ